MGQPQRESWRDIPGWPGYRASSLGRIGSDHPAHAVRRMPGGVRVLAPYAAKDGRRRINITHAGKRRKAIVGHLVCLAFHGPRPAGCGAEHLDGDLGNDRPGNLRWATEAQRDEKRLRLRGKVRA